MNLPLLPLGRIKLRLSATLAAQLKLLDEETYQRFALAVAFAEAALAEFYVAAWTTGSGVPVFLGIQLEIRFSRKHEAFYIASFVDLGNDTPPTPGHTVPERPTLIEQLLVCAGIQLGRTGELAFEDVKIDDPTASELPAKKYGDGFIIVDKIEIDFSKYYASLDTDRGKKKEIDALDATDNDLGNFAESLSVSISANWLFGRPQSSANVSSSGPSRL